MQGERQPATDRPGSAKADRSSAGRPQRDTYGFGTALAAAFVAALACLITCTSSPNSAPYADEREAGSNQSQPKESVLDANPHAQEAKQLPAPLRSLIGERQWLNTPPLNADDLRGKVVLVNFWTYSCINSLRVLPYLRAWAAKYKDEGLVVIGVHTPEFAFEHYATNITSALRDLAVGYSVVIDNDYGIWNAFNNNAWPGFYFVDASGQVRNRVLGEGRYEDSERLIQKLLSEAHGAAVAAPVTPIVGEGAQAPPDWDDLRTPETYVGFRQASNFSSVGGFRRDAPKLYNAVPTLSLNHWSLSGTWTVGGEFAELSGSSGRIAFRFHARDFHFVLGRGAADPIRFRVTLDGKAPGDDHGIDIDADGWGILDRDRMYQLVRQSGRIDDRTFEIEFLAPGARGYSFTFG